MLDQTLLNWLFAALGAALSWAFKVLYDAMKDLQKTDGQLADKVQSIEVLVAGQYVKRTDLDRIADHITSQLTRIEEKIDSKADRESRK